MTRTCKIFIVLVVFYMSIFSVKAEIFDIWVHIGIATPSANVATLYTEDLFDDFEGFVDNGADIGWSIGFNPQLILGDKTNLSFYLGYTRFSAANAKVINPETEDLENFFNTETTVIPIKVGINYYVVDSFFDILGIYVKGDIAYNYLSNSITGIGDYYDEVIDLKNQEFGRLGAGIGLGFDIELPIVLDFGIDIEYNWLNLIGKEDDELAKNYLGLALTIGF